jgi:endonuclease YncB( thermonuclease family)
MFSARRKAGAARRRAARTRPAPRRPLAAALAAVALAIAVLPDGEADALASSLVFLNGVASRVHFNDGDSFRVLDGRFAGTKARLEGFNTLESFGPAHSWGNWNVWELYFNAKQATYHARRGVWHCFTDGDRDGYGRVLFWCPDLAVSQVENGFAHVYSVDDRPGRIELIRAQRRAILARRGMWAHGVPQFVVTSIHSADEDPSRDRHYNRMISTYDGATYPWAHNDTYRECQRVCATEPQVDYARIEAASMKLREDRSLARVLEGIDNLHLMNAVARWARDQVLPDWVEEPRRERLAAAIEALRAAGELGEVRRAPGACMVHVEFNRRYGPGRAACLRH